MEYKLINKKFSLPKDSSVDSLTEMFRAAITQKGSIQNVLFTIDPPELSIDLFIPTDLIPQELPENNPEDVWQVLVLKDMEEVSSGSPKLNTDAVSVLTTLMLKAASRKVSGVAWAVGSTKKFLRWLGVKGKQENVSAFWDLPLIETPELQPQALVLMCAKTKRASVLEAEVNFLAYMEEKDAGQGK